jgi:hypothetical protein
MANKTYVAFVDKQGGTTATTYIGNEGELFYDPSTTILRVSDGVTPGGSVVGSGSGSGDNSNTGNVIISSNTSGNAHIWTFGDDGNLTIADNGAIRANNNQLLLGDDDTAFEVRSGFGSNLRIESGGISTGRTVPSNLYLEGGGSSALNVDAGNLYLNGGGGATGDGGDVIITGGTSLTGEDGEVQISSNNYTWTFDAYGVMQIPVMTWGQIYDAPDVGKRTVITDADLEAIAANFGEIVGGGGANVAPVWADGSDWRIG